MRRRDFLGALGSAVAVWTITARAQQPAMLVVGYLSVQELAARPHYLAAFRDGLVAEGFVEGRNLTIEYRSADSRPERLPELAAELVQRRVAVIATSGGPPAALAAKRATGTIPIVFASGGDPTQLGLVSKFNQPDKNLTGMYFLLAELVGKRLALLHELLPRAKRVAVLINPTNIAEAEPTVQNVQIAGRALGLEIEVFRASAISEINLAFEALVRWRAEAFFVGPDPLFSSRAEQIVSLEARYKVPGSYFIRDFVQAGGTMSYGPNIAQNQRQLGIYAGRILKGEKVSNLPVVQPTNYDLAVNLRTAKAFGLEVPPMLLARIDEVIE
jgi:putative ABC transport system substrate-binding protein